MNKAKGPSSLHSPFSAPACALLSDVEFRAENAVAEARHTEWLSVDGVKGVGFDGGCMLRTEGDSTSFLITTSWTYLSLWMMLIGEVSEGGQTACS